MPNAAGIIERMDKSSPLSRLIQLLPVLLLLMGCAFPAPWATAEPEVAEANPGVEPISVYFTGSRTRADRLIKDVTQALRGAESTIDLAMYNFNLDAVGFSLIEAQQRGVRVRVLMDSDAADGRWFPRLEQAGVAVRGDGREELMHNKYLIIDQKEVWTGSLNLTANGVYEDANNFVRFASEDMAEAYTANFAAMFEENQFGVERESTAKDKAFTVGEADVEVLFSPEDQIARRLIREMKQAKKSVSVLAYSFTSDSLADTLLTLHENGVEVRMVFDEEQIDHSGADYGYLRQSGIEARLDATPWLQHHKVVLIDDQTVITGSYNYTRSAEVRNDENVVIVRDAHIAALFGAEFERIFEKGD